MALASSAPVLTEYETVLAEIDLLDQKGIRKYARDWNVAEKLTQCKTTQQMKDLLRYEWTKNNGKMKNSQGAGEIMRAIYDCDVKRRAELKSLFTQLRAILDGVMKDERLRTQLETEELTTAADYETTIHKFTESLSEERCPIVLAGETSSGKSTLLNLFMSEAVLPAKTLSCTSTVCELIYGDEPKGQLVPRRQGDGEVKQFPYDERDEFIYKKHDRQTVFDHIVQLFVPLHFLQSGVTLVDTPGISEKEMKQILLDYVNKSSIYGFIYVIKSDNAGGLAKDRLQQLLVHLTKLKNEYGVPKFDPRMAIFVCNRWDMVPEDEREVVHQDIIDKLTLCWPGFDPERQLFKMNTEFAFRMQEAGYITDDYAKLLNAVEELLPLGLQCKLKIAYWWLDRVLVRLHHSVRVCLNPLTDEELQSKMKHANERVESITRQCDEFADAFKGILNDSIKYLSKDLVSYFEMPSTMRTVKKWTRDDLPAEECGDSWPILRAMINDAINARLGDVVRKWEHEKQLMVKQHHTLLGTIKSHTKSIAKQVEHLEKYVRSTSITEEADTVPSKGTTDGADSVPSKGCFRVPSNIKEVDFFRDLKNMNNAYGVITLQQYVRAAVGVLLVKLMEVTVKEHPSASEDKDTQYKLYKQNRVKYVAEKAADALKSLQKHEVAWEIVEDQMEPLASYVADVRKQVPKILRANQQILQSITDDKVALKIREMYQPLMEELSEMLNLATSFSYEALTEFEMTCTDVVINTSGSSQAQVDSTRKAGLFASYTTGQLRKDEATTVTVKNYHQRMCNIERRYEQDTIRSHMEEGCDFIPKLLGVMQDKSLMPALVFDGELITARQWFWSQTSQSLDSRRLYVKKCHAQVESLSEALKWLHSQGLVHMEVSLDSVLVQADGGVKLTNLGESRSFHLNATDLAAPAESFIYLPPEVLRGEPYTPASDIYSLGIFIWEAVHAQEVFVEQRKSSLHDFIELSNPCNVMILGVQTSNSAYGMVSNVVTKCMDVKAEKRLNIRQFQKQWDSTEKYMYQCE